MRQTFNKKPFKSEFKREERDNITDDDFTDALKQVLLAEGKGKTPEKREPTARELKMRFKLERRG